MLASGVSETHADSATLNRVDLLRFLTSGRQTMLDSWRQFSATLVAWMVFCLFAAAPIFAQEKPWSDIVAAAKREGRVVLAAAPDPLMRQAIPEKFTARFGVTVEYLGGRSSEMSTRLRAERQAGQYMLDAITGGL